MKQQPIQLWGFMNKNIAELLAFNSDLAEVVAILGVIGRMNPDNASRYLTSDYPEIQAASRIILSGKAINYPTMELKTKFSEMLKASSEAIASMEIRAGSTPKDEQTLSDFYKYLGELENDFLEFANEL